MLDCIGGGHSHAEDESGHSHNECSHDVHELNIDDNMVHHNSEMKLSDNVKKHKKFLEIFKGKNNDT